MKKFLFLFASMMLLGGYLVNAATTENASSASAQTENAKEVVTVHLNFIVDAQTVRFQCPEYGKYDINIITVCLHNVDVYQWGSSFPDYNTTAWIQLAFSSESEIAPIVLRPESYVALDEIVVEGSDDYEYDFVVTGITAM